MAIPYLHFLWSLDLSDTELQDLATAAGFGIESSIEPVYSRSGAITYIAKSLLRISTDPNGKWPPGTRLYGTSRSVPTLPRSRKGRYTRIPQLTPS
jgi:hypothetical protein